MKIQTEPLALDRDIISPMIELADGTKLTSFTFSLEGELPSKKNSWKPRTGGGFYIPKDVQADIDALLWQLKSVRYKLARPIVGSISIGAYIFTKTKKQDTDNRYTTLQDILQMGQIIANDNDVDRFHCDRIVSEVIRPRVDVLIYAS